MAIPALVWDGAATPIYTMHSDIKVSTMHDSIHLSDSFLGSEVLDTRC